MSPPRHDPSANAEGRVATRESERLAQLLLAAQEEERQRIAADLHDEIGQCLSTVQFAVEGLKQQLDDRMTDAERHMCTRLDQYVAHAIEQTRRICMGLRPPMLDDLGVICAINWFCNELRQVLEGGMEVRQDMRAEEDAIPDTIKIAIFRILQEACGNACKHSRANLLLVRLETDAEGIRLEVADDGVGFAPASARLCGNGSGLDSMRERAAMTDGCLVIESQIGMGSLVRAVWPAGGSAEDPA